MTLLVVDNYPHTELGILGRVIKDQGHQIKRIAAYAGEALPAHPERFSGLILLGGAQNALADEAYPFFPQVCALIRAFHEAGRPVLGICLGSQLIARAFGGRNILDRPVEFGWHEVRPTAAGKNDPVTAALGQGVPQFHWHTDTVELPEAATHLATSGMTPVQAFRMGRKTYGLQFHFETGLEEVRTWSTVFADEIGKHTPDWPQRFEPEAQRHADAADQAGAAIAKGWLSLLDR